MSAIADLTRQWSVLFLAFGMAMALGFSVIVGGLPIADGREPRFLSDTTWLPHLNLAAFNV